MNKRVTALCSSTILLASTMSAGAAPYEEHPRHMWGGAGWGFGHGAISLLMLLLIVALIGALIFAALRGSHKHPPQPNSSQEQPNAMQILDERLARGEIDLEDYERRRDALSGQR